MNRQPIMRHLHLGCGESLSQLLPELNQSQSTKTVPQKPVMQLVRKHKKRGGRA